MLPIIDLIYPKTCFACGKKIQKNYLCKECYNNLIFMKKESICPICGSIKNSSVCHVCSNTLFSFDIARSIFVMNNVIRSLIHNFKYKDYPIIGKILANFAIEFMKKSKLNMNIDIIIPVPLHKVKKKIRGYNQSYEIGKYIAKYFNLKISEKIIKRKKFTESQTKLTKLEREKNVANAFSLNKKISIKNKNFLIVDDVFTTGSTVNSISKLLKSNNANKVYVLTIARAI